jgi:hypothetical protein
LASLFTIAVKTCFPISAWMLGLAGATATEIGGGVTVIVADADWEESAADVALIITVAGLGVFAGAV